MMEDAKKIKGLIFAIFFLFIVFYGFARSTDLIFGVKIRDVNLTDGAVVSQSVTKITGNAKNAINLTINGREISIDLEGNFDETIALSSGYNIITIRAEDKFGYVDEKNYKLILKE